MNDDPLAVALKFGFLAVLYLFLLWVCRSALRDLARGQNLSPSSEAVEGPASSRRREPSPRGGLLDDRQPRLEVIAALGYQPGITFDIPDGATLGRSDSVEIPVDDPFASASHARIFRRGNFMHIEDMGSTNGTYLNGRQLLGAERLEVADVIRIGDSEYRYQE